MTFIEEQISKIKTNTTVIVYPEGAEPDIIKAAEQLVCRRLASPVLIGEINKIMEKAAEIGADLAGVELINPKESPKTAVYAETFAKICGFPETTAKILLKKPLYYAAMMTKAGDADCMAAGIITETAEVVAAYKMILGMEKGIITPSCISIVEAPGFQGEEGGLIAMSDTAINENPMSEELADIAISSARTVKKLLDWMPRVALLSFSTLASSGHECARKVADAVKLAQSREPGLLIDGEMQLDTAVSPEVAKRKFTRPSQVAGRANVLVFPNLDSSNIGIKLLQRLGNASSSGGILQGFSKPVCDLSRGANAEQVVRNAVMLIRLSEAQKPS